MTTDAGIDLVVFNPSTTSAVTVQVKANEAPKPGGGKGKLALDWWIPHDCPADLVAVADLSTNQVWLFKTTEMNTIAQQSSSGRWHLYMYTDARVQTRSAKPTKIGEFDPYLLHNRVATLFPVISRRPSNKRLDADGRA